MVNSDAFLLNLSGLPIQIASCLRDMSAGRTLAGGGFTLLVALYELCKESTETPAVFSLHHALA